MDEEDEDAAEGSSRPRLGHVSMITDAILSPSQQHIITADRDEHIRVSRWGPKRAGWVIERFLLGSKSFVGSIAQVQEQTLISSDGGKYLRTWNLKTGACTACVDIGDQLARHFHREALPQATLRPSRHSKQEAISDEELLAIVQVDVVGENLLVRAEASKAVFLVPSASVLAGHLDGWKVVKIDRPILQASISDDGGFWLVADSRHGEGPEMFHVAADQRVTPFVAPEMMTGERFSPLLVRRLLLTPRDEHDTADEKTLRTIDLYTAIQSWRKLSSEGKQSGDLNTKGKRSMMREQGLKKLFGEAAGIT